VADVGAREDVARTFATLARDAGRIDILVNNAGIAASAALGDTDATLWESMLRVNLSGPMHCIQAAYPSLLEAPHGRIVNIASTAGLIGYADVSAYCASKHGLVGLTRALARELARTSITVNAVCPGYTDTEIVHEAVDAVAARSGKTRDDARALLAHRNPQRRLVAPGEVAATVAWLCLPEAQAITGQAIAVAGGEVMTG